MPRFRFEAMDSTGGASTDHIEAGNADEAMQMLHARGLFIAKLKEVPDVRDNPGSSERLATDASSDSPRPNWWFGAIFMIVGLATVAVGLYGMVDSTWFRMRADRATALVVEVRNDGSAGWDYDILEFTVASRSYRVESRGSFGFIFATSHGLKSQRDVWYPPNHPENARIAEFSLNFGGPIILLVLGLLFTPAGVLVLRRVCSLLAIDNLMGPLHWQDGRIEKKKPLADFALSLDRLCSPPINRKYGSCTKAVACSVCPGFS